MEENKELRTRKLIGKVYSQHPGASLKFIYNKIKGENIPKSIFYSIIKRIKDGIGLDRQPGSGRKRKNLSPKVKED